MAKKQEEKPVLERTYNVPLRREWLKSPKYKRAKKAIAALKKFLAKHTKSDNIKIGKYANLEIWKHGIKNPPHHIKVEVVKDKEGLVSAEIVGAPKEKKVEKKAAPKKKDETKTKFEQEISKLKDKTKKVMSEKATEAVKAEKEEIKELKEEKPKTPAPAKENPKKEVSDKAPKDQQGVARGEHRAKA